MSGKLMSPDPSILVQHKLVFTYAGAIITRLPIKGKACQRYESIFKFQIRTPNLQKFVLQKFQEGGAVPKNFSTTKFDRPP